MIIRIKCRSGGRHMRYIDYRARFFAVVGAPDVAKRHADARHHSSHETRHPVLLSGIVAERRSLTDQPAHCSTTLQWGSTETS